MEVKIKYDVPFEVTKKQYEIIVRDFSGVMCHMVKDSKYYIKVWLMAYAKYIKQVLNNN
jgi:hypothetical protein